MILISTTDFPLFHYTLGAILVVLFYGDVSVMGSAQRKLLYGYAS